METYGYIRVSSKEQNPERQVNAMRNLKIDEDHIYLDFMSGKDFNRPSYKRVIRRLKPHDLLVVKSIDRLGRNYEEILDQWRFLTKKKEVDIQVIDMPLLNTRTDVGGLTGVFIADLVLQILAYVAETERAFIKQRQSEGIAIAKAKGVRFGCKRIELSEEDETTFEEWKCGGLTALEAAKKIGISRATFYRRCREKRLKN